MHGEACSSMQEATVKRLSALQKNRCAYACRKRVGKEACGEVMLLSSVGEDVHCGHVAEC